MDISKYKVTSSNNFDLDKFNTSLDLELSKDDYKIKFSNYIKRLYSEQFKLYANSNNAMLIVLQGMDAAGKDGIIKHVLSNLNTQGTEVHSFKAPSKLELSHDFLWRHYIVLPPKGKIGIFNRSHYENVLVTKVHPEIILNENLPNVSKIKDIDEDFWQERYEQIVNFENHLSKNGTIVVKIFLNLSKDEQSSRLLSRIEEKKKNWKFSKGDFEERKFWNEYRSAFSDAIKNTSKKRAPWYVVPADNKPYARMLVAKILYKELKQLDLKVPEVSIQQQKDLDEYRKFLSAK